MSALLQLATDVVILAEPAKPKGPEFGKSGPLGLAVIVALLAVTFFLIRSMNKHVKNLPESFDDEAPGQGDEAGGTDRDGIDPALRPGGDGIDPALRPGEADGARGEGPGGDGAR